MYLNTIKSIDNKPAANIMLNREKLKVFFLRFGTEKEGPLSPFIQHPTGNPSQSHQAQERKKIQIRKEEVKLSLFVEDMIVDTENPKRLYQEKDNVSLTKLENTNHTKQISEALIDINSE